MGEIRSAFWAKFYFSAFLYHTGFYFNNYFRDSIPLTDFFL